jgi:hypothetical protein
VAKWDAAAVKHAGSTPVNVTGGVSLPPAPSVLSAITRWDKAIEANAKAAAKKTALAEKLLEEQVRAHNRAEERYNEQHRLGAERRFLEGQAIITHVHMGKVQTPKEIQAATHRHAKRNGRSNVLPAVGARAPTGFTVRT